MERWSTTPSGSPLHGGRGGTQRFPKTKTIPAPPLCKDRAVKFFAFCHPELAKDLLQQREILAGDASLPLSMTAILQIMTEWFPGVTKATKGQNTKNLTALRRGEFLNIVVRTPPSA